MKRTSFVAFPPKISEKSITFEMPVLFFVHEVDTPNPEVSHNTTSEVVNTADLNSETDEIFALPHKGTLTEDLARNSKTDIPNGDREQTVSIGSPEHSLEKPVLGGEISHISEQVATNQAKKVERTTEPSGQISSSDALGNGENISQAKDRPALSISQKSGVQAHPTSTPEVFSEDKESTISSRTPNEKEALAQNASQTVAAKSETGTPILSTSVTEPEQKSLGAACDASSNQLETSGQARYGRPIVQSGKINALKTEIAQSEVKDALAQKIIEPKAQINEPLSVKDPREKAAKTEVQKTELGTLATAKANVRKAENANQLQAHPMENGSDESLIAKKQAVVENLPLLKYTTRRVSENQTFEIPQPNIKLSAQRPEVLPKPQTITDFSARAVEAMVSQNLGTARKTTALRDDFNGAVCCYEC